MRVPLFLGLVLFLGCKEAPPPPAPPLRAPSTDFSQALTYTTSLDANGQVLTVELSIAPGFHAYTTGETTGRPLALTVDETSDFASNGPVDYPKGVTKDLELGRSVIVTGAAEISAPVAPREGTPGKTVAAEFAYQVCTDEACDRPRKVVVSASR